MNAASIKHEYADKYVHVPNDVPRVEHWAIIRGSSVFIEGDESSRTNPGHGYPAENKPVVEYEAYLTEDKFKRQVTLALFRNENVIGLHVAGVYTKDALNIDVSMAPPKV